MLMRFLLKFQDFFTEIFQTAISDFYFLKENSHAF